MSAVLTIGATELHDYPLRSISGFHRPLNGESSNVTVTVDSSDWSDFQTPLLGAPATLVLDGDTLMSGYLTQVTWGADLALGIEG